MTSGAARHQLGWHDDLDEWAAGLAPGTAVGRVVRVDRGEVDVALDLDTHHDVRATATTAAKDCVAGDWVALDLDAARVVDVAPRRTAFVRRAARGARVPQTLAANLDVVVVVTALVPDVPVRRLERELVLAHQSGARPLVVLTKADLVDDDGWAGLAAATAVAPGVDVLVVSNRTGAGLDTLGERIGPGRTFALLGASGVGKSSLANSLAGEELQLVGEVRDADLKGRHTTTAARLLRIAGGRLLLDTPGVRALALWEAWDGLAAAFADVEALAAGCQFSDCFHDDEPGCAVVDAAGRGELDADRLDNWRRMRDEMAVLDADLTESDRRRRRPGRPTTGS